MSEWVSPRDVFGKAGSKPYVRAVVWLQANANHAPKVDPNDRRRRLYHRDDFAAYERNRQSFNTASDWLELLKPYLDTPRTAKDISDCLLFSDNQNYDAVTIKKWLERFVESGQVVRTGKGVRNDPHCYQLAEVADA